MDIGVLDIGVLGQTTNRLRGRRIVRVFFSSVIQWNQGLRFLEKDKFFVLVYFGWFYFGTNHKGWDEGDVPEVPEVPGFMFQMYPMFQKYLLPYEMNKFYL